MDPATLQFMRLRRHGIDLEHLVHERLERAADSVEVEWKHEVEDRVQEEEKLRSQVESLLGDVSRFHIAERGEHQLKQLQEKVETLRKEIEGLHRALEDKERSLVDYQRHVTHLQNDLAGVRSVLSNTSEHNAEKFVIDCGTQIANSMGGTHESRR